MYKEYQLDTRKQASQGDFWDVHWGANKPDLNSLLATMEKRDTLAHLFDKRLPKKGRILEAGCGVGQYAAYLRRRGHPIEGLDFSESTIAFAKSAFPDVPFFVGDLRNINVPDGAYDAVVCLGVIEHFEDGPEPLLKELRRVLSKDGLLYISVPYESLSFRITNWISRLRGLPVRNPDSVFYQYRFRKKEYIDTIARAGFKINETSYYAGIVGIKRRIAYFKEWFGLKKSSANNASVEMHVGPAAHKLWSISRFYPLVWFLETCFPFFAHMILVVASPNKGSE